MNGFAQPYANGAAVHQQRHSIDSAQPSTTAPAARAQAERNGGAMPMPMRTGAYPGEAGGMMGMTGPFPGPRSPPKNKNTAHVPCKFFLQGQCQAGRTCPFSHDLDSTMRPMPCKYFAKGGCKFGRKCALLHVTADGNVMNRGGGGPFMAAQAQYQQGPQSMQKPRQYPAPPPGLLAQGLEQRPNGEGIPEDYTNFQYLQRAGYETPQIDMTYTSASPQYGSPPSNDRMAASPPGLGFLASSPPAQGLTMADAKFPSSFDSNGISMAARNGPFAASVPSRFGIESPPASLPRKAQLGNTALRDLHSSAFGDNRLDGMLAGLGSSPPSGTDEPLTFPKRTLHSDRLRAASGQPFVSASVGTKLPTESFGYSDEDDEDDGDTDREEELIPASLRDLIPEGRSRRDSRARNETDDTIGNTPAAFLASQRRTISSHGTPQIPQDSKVGSPHQHSGSPSRYSGTFARMSSRENGDSHSRVVGSPLRNEGFPNGFFTPAPSRPNNGDMSPGLASPPKQASMSMLTQELQRTMLDKTKLGAARAASATYAQTAAGLHPATGTRSVSSGGATATAGSGLSSAVPRKSVERAVSNGSVGATRIEEEEVFSMDDTLDEASK